MIDIKQQELDKAFVKGALMIESALIKRRLMTTDANIDQACKIVYDIILAEIGEERWAAIRGENSKEPRA